MLKRQGTSYLLCNKVWQTKWSFQVESVQLQKLELQRLVFHRLELPAWCRGKVAKNQTLLERLQANQRLRHFRKAKLWSVDLAAHLSPATLESQHRMLRVRRSVAYSLTRVLYKELITSRISAAVSLGVLPTLTPTASKASFLAWAVPAEPETIAPACPMVLPSGAVNPAT